MSDLVITVYILNLNKKIIMTNGKMISFHVKELIMQEIFEKVKNILNSEVATIKMLIVSYGLYIDGAELARTFKGYPENYRTKRCKKNTGLSNGVLVDRETKDYPWIPEEIFLIHSSGRSVVKVNYSENSPFKLMIHKDKTLIVAEELNIEIYCDLPLRRSTHNIQIDGCPADNYVQVIGSDRVAILGYDGCHGWFTGKQCKFCDSCASRSGETFGRPSLNDLRIKYNDNIDLWLADCQERYFEGLKKAYKLVLKENISPHFHLHLMAGNLPDLDREWVYMLDLINAINAVKPLNEISDSYLNILPPWNNDYMKKAYNVGCKKVIFNLEVFTEKRYSQICPDKNDLMPYNDFLQKMKDAVKIFGWGNVRCGFVLGAQPIEELMQGVIYLAEYGIVSDYTIFTPKKGTPWQNRKRPDVLNIAKFTAFLTQIYRGYDFNPLYCRESARNTCINEIMDDISLWIHNNQETNKVIEIAANKIKTFKVKGQRLGFDKAKSRINNWIGNFFGLLKEHGPLPDILRKLEFISDEYILECCQNYLFNPEIKDKISEQKIYYTCFGEETESSARIMSSLNNLSNYAATLPKLLDIIHDRDVDSPVIVFFDDFINTAGQFTRILKTWCGQSLDNKRTTLTITQREMLQKCELLFVFYYGVEKARERAYQCLDEMELNGKIVILKQYIDEVGVFGTRDDMKLIKCNIDGWPDHPECNLSYEEQGEVLLICEQAGKELLQLYKPKWRNEGKESYYSERALGYGNSAKLFIGQTNIPTCSLTCLWLKGLIEVNNKVCFWIPLVDRVEKTLGGTEMYQFNRQQSISPIRNTKAHTKGEDQVSFSKDNSLISTAIIDDLVSRFTKTQLQKTYNLFTDYSLKLLKYDVIDRNHEISKFLDYCEDYLKIRNFDFVLIICELLFFILEKEKNIKELDDKTLNKYYLKTAGNWLEAHNHLGNFEADNIHVTKAQKIAESLFNEPDCWADIANLYNRISIAYQNIFEYQKAISKIKPIIDKFDVMKGNPFSTEPLTGRYIGALYGNYSQSLFFQCHSDYFYNKGSDFAKVNNDAKEFSEMSEMFFDNNDDIERQSIYRAHGYMQKAILEDDFSKIKDAGIELIDDRKIEYIMNDFFDHPDEIASNELYRISAIMKLCFLTKKNITSLVDNSKVNIAVKTFPHKHPYEQILGYLLLMGVEVNTVQNLLNNKEWTNNIIKVIILVFQLQYHWKNCKKIDNKLLKELNNFSNERLIKNWQIYGIFEQIMIMENKDYKGIGPISILPYNYC